MLFGKCRKILLGYKGPFIRISLGLTYLDGYRSLRSLVHLASRNIDKLKSIQRIHESMKMYASIFFPLITTF